MEQSPVTVEKTDVLFSSSKSIPENPKERFQPFSQMIRHRKINLGSVAGAENQTLADIFRIIKFVKKCLFCSSGKASFFLTTTFEVL